MGRELKIALCVLTPICLILFLMMYGVSQASMDRCLGCDTEDENAVILAIDSKNVDEAKQQIRLNSKENTSWAKALAKAAILGDKELIQMIRGKGGDTNLALFKVDTPQQAEALVQIGANVNVREWSGRVPLNDLVNSGNVEVVKWFLEHGASVNAMDARHQDVLADAKNNYNIAKALGAKDVPAMYAKIIELLKAHGAKE